MTSAVRAAKLSKHFNNVLQGKEKPGSGLLFLEAIYSSFEDPATTAQQLFVSVHGLPALQTSMRADTSPDFLNGPGANLIRYFSAPGLAQVNGGDLLVQILKAILEPPFFWNSLVDAFRRGELQDNAQYALAWLFLQAVGLPDDQAILQVDIARPDEILDTLLSSKQTETKAIAQKIQQLIKNGTLLDPATEDSAGGRHSNDFLDFREIAILPTGDELASQRKAFLRPSSYLDNQQTESNRMLLHLDNQYRLLREDMIYEMRDELDIVFHRKKGKQRGFHIDSMILQDLHTVSRDRSGRSKNCRWGLTFQCPNLKLFDGKLPNHKPGNTAIKPEDRRKAYLQDNKHVLKHQSMACLVIDDHIVAFATINRDEDLLIQEPSVIVLELEDDASTPDALLRLARAKVDRKAIKLFQINTAVFAYEPVLNALKEKRFLSLTSELLLWKEDDPAIAPPDCPVVLVQAIKADPRQNLKGLIGTPKDIVLDQAQAQSLIAGLSQRVSLIQGPPGTGKSFIGALLAKVLHDRTTQTILVVCYTNHALDQFLEDLLDIGIPETSLVRLGGNAKATDRTARFSIQNLTRASGFRRNKGAWEVIDRYKTTSTTLSDALDPLFNQYKASRIQNSDILEHIEFDDMEFYEAFRVPESDDGMQKIGKGGKTVQEDYLLQRWISGQHPGVFSSAPNVQEAPEIWSMPLPERRERYANWQKTIMAEVVELFAKTAKSYNKSIADTDRAFNDNEAAILSEKRIIGCTTTAAAKYRANLKAVNPGVLLVEEAGEILESHLLTACGDGTQQLILIGDHQQLRPKINNYELSVEKGEGFDLNRSLFERLVLKGYPHKTLVAQHRMRPEISTFVRALTYPDLIDAPKTQGRPDLRGVTDNVVFIQHDKPEDEDNELQERKDITAKSSKQNRFEVAMVLKTVRYLAQQGYGTDDMVVLTPYLGQLRALREALKSFDPVLSDLDSHELIKAGLLSPTTAKLVKKPLRLATIDNYQGEEAKIVIASLTRSNSTNDIGFMSSPERLNVLLSRARDSLILIGNLQTFQTARKGGEVWKKLLELLQKKRHVYDGLPTRCERHPDKRFLLKCPEDFDKFCPEGGCLEPCGVMLQCGVHSCPSKCHNLVDHSKMICDKIITAKCPEGHPLQWKCQKPSVCQKCAQEQKIREKKQQAEFEQQERRDKDAREHAEWIARIDSEIAQERELMKDAALAEERANAIKLKEKDLEDAKAQRAAKWSLFSAFPKFGLQQASQEPQASPDPSFPKVPNPPSDQPTAANANPQPSTSTQQPARSPKASKANDIWQHLKNVQGAQSDAIDKIMAMTGLEEVKLQVLNIKHKVDIAIRQNVSLKDERFSVLMLGNPGTGKTTIARLYGQFLAEMKIIPGQDFIETTGSRLANDGVPGAIKKLEQLSKADGGVFFIDEAYQLADDHEGKKVLEYLLAEIEALLGKVVFIFAGYDKEMEKLFENPGFFSRVPYTLKFADYKDNDLHDMLANSIQKQFGGRMKVDDPDGIYGLYGRILIRRLGRGRGTKGFGNARALANVFAKVLERQAERVANDRRTGKLPDDLLLMKEDLIGPAPENVFPNSEAWKKLQAMIGLAEIKKAVQNLFHMAQTNYDRELLELKPNQVSLNRVFIGSPGTGKTTVAKYYGQILAELGLLSNGEVIVKNPADFIGNVLGASESQTKAILNSTVGKVLVIDEAYMLYGGSKAGGSDSFKTAVIDTIVAEVQSGPSEDRCVLLVGYKEQMEEMFQNVNPGLSRRFAIDNAYEFKDYSDSELLQALEFKLKEHDLTCTDAAKQVAMDVLNRARNRPNFGNIGEVENLLNKAKLRYQERQASLPYEQRSPNAPFEPSDFDVDFNRGENAASNLAKLFEDVVGADEIVEKLGKWQQMSKNMKALGKDPRDHVPTTFVFKGPPGTGKTTTARKMGQVFRDMGFLSSAEVVECSASDLVGQYVGQTGPKTKQQFEKALGRVLFIDEAYRLADGHFAQEAMDELVGILTQERFRGKLIVILAGYDQDMNRLMAVNSGLSSRFPEELVFRNIEPEQCLTILKAKLLKNGVTIDALDDLSSSDRVRILELIQELSILPSWGNARDIETLAKKMLEVVYTSKDATSSLKLADAVTCVEAMLTSRRERATNVSTRAHHQPQLPVAPPRTANPPPRPIVSTNSTVAAAQKPKPKPTPTASSDAQRDPGVSDEVWAQLQRDKQAMLDEQKRLETAKADAERSFRQAVDEAKRKEKEAKAQSDALAKAQKEKALAADILRRRQNEIARQRELARLAELKVKAEKEKREAAKRELEQQRRQEAAVQTKLRSMGVCVAGFRWIKQHGGYRCAGGTHFISDAQLGV